MRVLCVKWGRKYGPEWVTRLRNAVARNLKREYAFACVTEDPVPGVTCIPLLCNLPTWWQKIGLFRYHFSGDNLYLDLDVVITGSLDPLVGCLESDRSKLWTRDDFSYSLRAPKQGIDEDMRRTLGGDGTINSSVMLWNGGMARDVWDKFTPDVMDRLHGDQNWITQVLHPGRIGFLPDDQVKSYKYHVLRGENPGPVTVFHGDPKPDQVREEWVRRHWQ